MTPSCMTPDELRLWHEANAVARWSGYAVSSPCVDCPLSWAQEMRLQGCCNGEPSGNRTGTPRGTVRGVPATERRRAQWRAAKQRQRVA